MFKKLVCCCILLLSTTVMASSMPSQMMNWHRWLKGLRYEALQQGIRPDVFDQAFRGVVVSRQVKKLKKNQPEKRLTYYSYRNTRADKYRIHLGIKYYKKHRSLINTIARQYGVSPCYIMSFWGLETSYGHFMGSFYVIRSLATLAYDSNRYTFFRHQLLIALHMLNDGDVSIQDFKGEWAGASGQPQFLPSSWKNYAVDYNGDGRKDIWKTKADIFASIANYLIKHGWQSNQPVLYKVRLQHTMPSTNFGLQRSRSVKQWQHAGVIIPDSVSIDDSLQASLLHPQGGPYWLVFNNFKVIMRWNRSIYYAGTVAYLAQRICL